VDILSPKPGWAEIDPEKLWNKVLEVLRESIREAGLNGNNVASIGISSQRGTFTIWSRKTGKPFFNLITWQDLRGAYLVKSWNQSITMRAFRIGGKLLHWVTRKARFKAAGILRLSNDMVTMRLLWVMQNIPSVKKAVEAGDAMFGCVESWLLYKMTGRHMTEVSSIAATGLFDPFTMRYGMWAFNLFSLPISIMPEIVPSYGNHFGLMKVDILGNPIPIHAVLGDQSASAFGSACYKPGMSKITMGTGSFLDVLTTSPHASLEGLAPFVAWNIDGEILYLTEGSVHYTGVMLDWARSIGLFANYDDICEIVSEISSSNGVYFVPGFRGLRAPIQDCRATAGFLGVTLSTTKKEMLRAVLESIVFSMVHLLEVFRAETGRNLEYLVVDGGVARNDFILQAIADSTGKLSLHMT